VERNRQSAALARAVIALARVLGLPMRRARDATRSRVI